MDHVHVRAAMYQELSRHVFWKYEIREILCHLTSGRQSSLEPRKL